MRSDNKFVNKRNETLRVMFTNYKIVKKENAPSIVFTIFYLSVLSFFYFIVIMRFGYIIQYQKPLAQIYLSDVAIFLSTAFAPL